MPIADLTARAEQLQALADQLGVPWRERAANLPADDPVAAIGLLADVLEIDFHLALDPAADLPVAAQN